MFCNLSRLLCNKQLVKKLFVNSCWSAIVLGSIMVGLGFVLRSYIIDNSQSATVSSSGLLFILIGIVVIFIGPLSALYDIVTSEGRRRQELDIESPMSQSSPRPSATFDPPSYDQVTSSERKTPSATYTMSFYPQILSADGLLPLPPSYEDIVGNDTVSSSTSSAVAQQSVRNIESNRRMTIS